MGCAPAYIESHSRQARSRKTDSTAGYLQTTFITRGKMGSQLTLPARPVPTSRIALWVMEKLHIIEARCKSFPPNYEVVTLTHWQLLRNKTGMAATMPN